MSEDKKPLPDNVIPFRKTSTDPKKEEGVNLEDLNKPDYQRRKEIDDKRRAADNARIRSELKRGSHPKQRW